MTDMEKDNKPELNYKSLLEKTSADLVILGSKDTCKSTLLKWLGREIMKDESNHLIIIETFPQFIHSFDRIPYMIIGDNEVRPKDAKGYMEENKSYIQWSKDYEITNAKQIQEFLKTERNCLFLVTCEEMESISAVMSFLIYQIYRKQYVRSFYNRLENLKDSYWFLIEESHNILDSTTVQKKIFSKLRKEQAEFRNFRMHMVCVAIRLQDLNPRIRSKMSLLLAKVSLDDFQLKIRNLLRNSKYRDEITSLPKGTFIYPETDQQLKTEPFKQQGTPYQWRPKSREIKQPKQSTKEPLLLRYLKFVNRFNPFGSGTEETAKDTDDGELDLYMSEEKPSDDDLLFPT